jgi:hypothetical protein
MSAQRRDDGGEVRSIEGRARQRVIVAAIRVLASACAPGLPQSARSCVPARTQDAGEQNEWPAFLSLLALFPSGSGMMASGRAPVLQRYRSNSVFSETNSVLSEVDHNVPF